MIPKSKTEQYAGRFKDITYFINDLEKQIESINRKFNRKTIYWPLFFWYPSLKTMSDKTLYLEKLLIYLEDYRNEINAKID